MAFFTRGKRERRNPVRTAITVTLAFASVACISGAFYETYAPTEIEEAPAVAVVETENPAFYHSDIPLSRELQELLYCECTERGVPVHIALGVINTESCFTETARNGICHGYMQISEINRDRLMETLQVDGITDGADNIRCGVYMLSELYQKYNDWNMTLIAYNCGEYGAKRDCFSKGIYSTNYTVKVNGYAEHWKSVIGGTE